MDKTILDKMGGERTCRECGYVEREVYRLFCPHCLQRDRLSALTTEENSHPAPPYPLDGPGMSSTEGIIIS